MEVGDETVDGYRQVYYVFNGEKVFVTDFDRKNSRNPMVNKEYVVWVTEINGAGQIFLYHIPTDTKTALTNSSTNLDPEVDVNGNVVWKRWVDDRWQIFFFDGISVSQLTEGDVSVDPDIEGDKIVFSRQDDNKEWRAVEFNIDNRQVNLLSRGQESKSIKIIDGEVVFPIKIAREEKEKEEREKKLLRQQIEQDHVFEESLREEETLGEDFIEIEIEDDSDGIEEESVINEDGGVDGEDIMIDEVEEILDENVEEIEDSIVESEPEEVLPTEPEIVTEEDIIAELEEEPIIDDEEEIVEIVEIVEEVEEEIIEEEEILPQEESEITEEQTEEVVVEIPIDLIEEIAEELVVEEEIIEEEIILEEESEVIE